MTILFLSTAEGNVLVPATVRFPRSLHLAEVHWYFVHSVWEYFMVQPIDKLFVFKQHFKEPQFVHKFELADAIDSSQVEGIKAVFSLMDFFLHRFHAL